MLFNIFQSYLYNLHNRYRAKFKGDISPKFYHLLHRNKRVLVSAMVNEVTLKNRLVSLIYLPFVPLSEGDRGSTVVKVLYYKSEGRWFDSRWCHWNFSLT